MLKQKPDQADQCKREEDCLLPQRLLPYGSKEKTLWHHMEWLCSCRVVYLRSNRVAVVLGYSRVDIGNNRVPRRWSGGLWPMVVSQTLHLFVYIAVELRFFDVQYRYLYYRE